MAPGFCVLLSFVPLICASLGAVFGAADLSLHNSVNPRLWQQPVQTALPTLNPLEHGCSPLDCIP